MNAEVVKIVGMIVSEQWALPLNWTRMIVVSFGEVFSR